MNILQNEQFQQALVTVLVLLLTAAARWLQLKMSQSAIVNDIWCYAQPVVATAMDSAAKAIADGKLDDSVAGRIIAESVAEFIKSFSKFEGSDPSAKQVAAVKAELAKAIGAAVK